jgi:hypothetical protein
MNGAHVSWIRVLGFSFYSALFSFEFETRFSELVSSGVPVLTCT